MFFVLSASFGCVCVCMYVCVYACTQSETIFLRSSDRLVATDLVLVSFLMFVS